MLFQLFKNLWSFGLEKFRDSWVISCDYIIISKQRISPSVVDRWCQHHSVNHNESQILQTILYWTPYGTATQKFWTIQTLLACWQLQICSTLPWYCHVLIPHIMWSDSLCFSFSEQLKHELQFICSYPKLCSAKYLSISFKFFSLFFLSLDIVWLAKRHYSQLMYLVGNQRF